jgi:hypothetical protein
MLEPVPVAVLGRAVWRLINAGMAAALLVHALDEQAKAFYIGRGFIESPIEPMTLMLRLFLRLIIGAHGHFQCLFLALSSILNLMTSQYFLQNQEMISDVFFLRR